MKTRTRTKSTARSEPTAAILVKKRASRQLKAVSPRKSNAENSLPKSNRKEDSTFVGSLPEKGQKSKKSTEHPQRSESPAVKARTAKANNDSTTSPVKKRGRGRPSNSTNPSEKQMRLKSSRTLSTSSPTLDPTKTNYGSKSSPKKRKYAASAKVPLEVAQDLCADLARNDYSQFFGYREEAQYLSSILENTIKSVDSNSVLVCGGRGSGKTALVEHCLAKIEAAEEDDVRVIRLNGFVNGNDLNAIRLIARRLDIEGGDVGQIMGRLRQESENWSKRAIVILDEFDIFCRRHQTLLYNLLDVAQARGSICIIALTTRLDCMELLEKRVKSRMNQRIIHLTAPFREFDDFVTFALQLMGEKVELSQDLETRLNVQFSKSKSVRDLKRFLIQELTTNEFRDKKEKLENEADIKVNYLLSLPFSELAVLMLAIKYTTSKAVTGFNCRVLTTLLHEIPAQMNLSKSLLLKVVNNLVDSGFMVMSPSTQRSALFLSEWTPLSLNVEESHIKEALAKNENALPLNMKQLLSTQ